MKVTFFALGSRGDVWPMVALAWHLSVRGHDVTVAVPGEFREFTERAGLRTAPLPFNGGDWVGTPEGKRVLKSGTSALVRFLADEYSRHADAFDEAYEAAAQGADALVGMVLTWDRAFVLGELLRIPVAVVHPIPIAPSREYSSHMVPTGWLPTGALRRASHEWGHRIWWSGNAKATRAFRRKLGLADSSRPTYRRAQDPSVLGLHTFSSSLFPRPTDWPDNLKVTGAWQMPGSVRGGLGEGVPADLQGWIDAGEAPIYMGFGSMPVLDPEPLLEHVIDVTASLGRRAILDASWVPPQALDTLPDHLRVVGAVDHDRLLPQCSAVVNHGGIGSVIASLRAGRPTMVCAVLGNQFCWGEQMRHLGVGADVPLRALDRDSLEAGLLTLLDPTVEERARTLGAAIRAEGDGLPEATQLFEQWVEVAEPQLA